MPTKRFSKLIPILLLSLVALVISSAGSELEPSVTITDTDTLYTFNQTQITLLQVGMEEHRIQGELIARQDSLLEIRLQQIDVLDEDLALTLKLVHQLEALADSSDNAYVEEIALLEEHIEEVTPTWYEKPWFVATVTAAGVIILMK